ncbi:PREDICTED: ladderlectin-like [Poecilia mexicana]|uniref:C-type lectin domain-containing protein n=1 Tax=Poecilia mexicana TaxID=48701 RepID=A0A3B3WV91_9TELE|nr:PREDICTED: ladderlectin-like [Poecilia mexicana]
MKLLAVFLLVFSMVALTSGDPVPDGGSPGDAAPSDADEDQVDLLQRSNSCPSGWTQINSRCFQYVLKPMSWARAERNCLSMGANLGSVQDLNEYRQIQAMIATASYEVKTAWIGGTDAQELNIWLWSDGSRFTYTDWCSGEPSNYEGKQHCIQMNYSVERCWDDLNCADRLPSVCVKKP